MYPTVAIIIAKKSATPIPRPISSIVWFSVSVDGFSEFGGTVWAMVVEGGVWAVVVDGGV